MNFLADAAVKLQFEPFAFIENMKYMGVGMLVIFVVIAIIVGTTMLINWLFSEK